jgi:hypothetical protein
MNWIKNRKETLELVFRILPVKDKICMFIAFILPKKIVKYCLTRAGAFATDGKYKGVDITEIKFQDVCVIWLENK